MMSTPYGVSLPYYVHASQTDAHATPFVEPYSASRIIHPPKQHFFWDSIAQQSTPGLSRPVSFDRTSVTQVVTNQEEDKDEFLTFGTCVSLRGERSGNDQMQPNYQYQIPVGLASESFSKRDDSAVNVPMSAGLYTEEECDQEILNTMHNGLQSSTLDYGQDYGRDTEVLRRENLRLHEQKQLSETEQHIINGETQHVLNGDVDLDAASELEEIIEEEICTIKRNRPETTASNVAYNQQELTEYLERQDEATQSMSPERKHVASGHWSTQQHHLIDLSAPVIHETQFPAEYWSRLEELFYSRFLASRPTTRELGIQTQETTHRTTATMAVPFEVPADQRCFGVSVSPAVQTVGVMTPRVSTREFGCTTIESEAVLKEWVENRLLGVNEATRKLVRQLFKSSMHSREEFLETILRVIKREQRHIGLQTQPKQQSRFADTGHTYLVSTASGDTTSMDRIDTCQTESKMVEARPILSNRSTLTHKMIGSSVACETEAPLLRSQGAQATPDVPDVTACGVQVGQVLQKIDQALDPIFSHTRQATFGVQVACETLETKEVLSKSSEEVERLWQGHVGSSQTSAQSGLAVKTSFMQQNSAPQSGTTTTITKTATTSLPGHDGVAQPSDFQVHTETEGQQLSASSTRKYQDSKDSQPIEVQRTEKVVIGSPTLSLGHRSSSSDNRVSESLRKSDPYWNSTSGLSEGYTVSTERRMVDEMSRRHLLPDDVDLEALTRGGQEALNAALARAKDLGSTHVIREFLPETEVISHADDNTERLSPFTPTTPVDSVFHRDVHAVSPSFVNESNKIAGVQIPVIYSPTTGHRLTSEQARSIPVELVSGFHSQTTARQEPIPIGFNLESSATEETNQIVPQLSRAPQWNLRRVTVEQSSPKEKTGETQDTVDTVTTNQQTVIEGTSSTSHQFVQIPPRNHSFVMPSDAWNACEVLTKLYRNNRASQNQEIVAQHLEKLSAIWFSLTSATKIELEQLEDFVGILHGFHEHLLRDVMQSVDNNGTTSLHYAVGHGAWPVVNLILDSGYAQPDRFNASGFSSIMASTACNVSDNAALTTLNRLYNAGDVNLRANTRTRQTPLMLAAMNGSNEVVELLLRHGALVNLQDRSGNTALMFAIDNGNLNVINTLLDRPELDLSLKDNMGNDALAIAKSKGNITAYNMIKRVLDGHTSPLCEQSTVTTTTTTSTESNNQN